MAVLVMATEFHRKLDAKRRRFRVAVRLLILGIGLLYLALILTA